jgi:hypothetical protein
VRNLSLIGEPRRLSVARSLSPKIDQRSEAKKPHPGDFLRLDFKFTQTSEKR